MVEWGEESPTPNDRQRSWRERKPNHKRSGKRIIAGRKPIVKGEHFTTFLCWDEEAWVEIRGITFEEGRCLLVCDTAEELRGHIVVACETLQEHPNPLT